MININVALNSFQTAMLPYANINGAEDEVNLWNSPIRLYFEIVEDSDKVQNHGAELCSHIQRQASVGCTNGLSVNKDGCQANTEKVSQEIDTQRDPSIEIICHSSHANVVVNAFQGFRLKSLLRSISTDGY
jgi:hypothetical protein